MTQLDMGKDLRDAALEKSKQGREARIEMIRNLLSKKSWADPATHLDPPEAYEFCGELTADDVWEAAAELGLAEGDTRWLGSVLRSWSLVMNTGHYTPSRRKVNHARPIPVFRWV